MENRNAPCRARQFLSLSSFAILAWAGHAAWVYAIPQSEVRVELDCKIVSAAVGAGYRPWIVEVRRSDGDPIAQAIKTTGETVRVKDLRPGIYQVCIMGLTEGRCESVDLNVPDNKKSGKFKKRLATPEQQTDSSNDNAISIAELSIPREARLQMVQAEQAEISGDSEDAFHHLEQALELDPDCPDALNNMGVHFYHSKDYAKSTEYLRKAVDADPNYFVAWANLGSSVLATGDFSEALKINRRALNLRPRDARANMQMGLSYYYVRDYAHAIKYIEKAALLDPLSASAPQLFLAQIAIFDKRPSDAEHYLREFLKLHPNCTHAARIREVLTEVEASHPVSIPSFDLSSEP